MESAMRRLVLSIPLAVFAASLIGPGGAQAAATCTLNPLTGALAVDNTIAPSDQLTLLRTQNNIDVRIGGTGGALVDCINGPATVTNTDSITVTDGAAHNLVLLVSLLGGAFEPGMSNAGDILGSPEIEINLVAAAGTDRIEVDGSDNAESFDLGQSAAGTFLANLNPGSETVAPDCDDVSATGVEDVIVRGRGGDDNINAVGCDSLTGIDPLDPGSLLLEGNNEDDVTRGGPGADGLRGGTQADSLIGGAGDDLLDGERGNDTVDGGAGADGLSGGTETDRVLYEDRRVPVTATIGNGAPDDGDSGDQSGGARDNIDATVENITGGMASDLLIGSLATNVMDGGPGDDSMSGLGGNDTVDGGLGNDNQDGGAGADKVRGESGADTSRGGSGKDKILGGDSADKLLGGPGGDLLRGERGRDKFKGQGGGDKLAARDGKRDLKINCGAGKARKENATVDRKDPPPKSC
jgi:Ca2+-binding RTX toxin-like protein